MRHRVFPRCALFIRTKTSWRSARPPLLHLKTSPPFIPAKAGTQRSKSAGLWAMLAHNPSVAFCDSGPRLSLGWTGRGNARA